MKQTLDSATLGARFPDDFLWGAATSSYQIEGAATEDGRSPSIWDAFAKTDGAIEDGSSGDVACDHYHRWRGDIALMGELGLGAYRFSIAWPRVIPGGTGAVNAAGLDFYDRLVDALLEAGIEPWPTLYHWDLPQVLEDRGGWPARETAEAFAEYTDIVTRRLGDRVTTWTTLNEPWVSSILGYAHGLHAPGVRDWGAALQAAHHLLLGHGLAAPIIRANSPGARVGAVLNLTPIRATTNSDADRAAAHRHDGHLNRWFLDPLFGRGYPADMLEVYGERLTPQVEPGDMEAIASGADFLGINYYMTFTHGDAPDELPLRAALVDTPDMQHTAMGWPVEAAGLHELLVRLNREYPSVDLYITENGSAFDDPQLIDGELDDPLRVAYLGDHLDACATAIADGARLRGYFAWSLLDNFEWGFGYTKRFGIVHVDFQTQQRTIKRSGRSYANVIAAARRASAQAATLSP